ncbi:MAG: HAD family phosphatase [Acidobacteriota bacterium]
MLGLLLGFDGVLIDDSSLHAELLCRALGSEGLEVSPVDLFGYLAEGGRGGSVMELDRQVLERVLEKAGIEATPSRLSRLVARKAAFFQMRRRSEGPRAVEGAREMIRSAAAAGWMLGVVTTLPREEVESGLEQLELSGLFKTVVAAGLCDPENRSACYVHAFRELNALPPLPSRLLHPHEVLVLDSDPKALEAARQVGFATAGFSAGRAAAGLEEKSDSVFESLPRDSAGLARLLHAGS